ncbi:hypothetical protein [Pseudomonas lactis]|uniref:hypothetical protein n=1 Tax=Pseudomonas lactis TaxID=1615674 RepID=UPI001A0F701B|nr:hypothetical protein [Pseudomonas lactis]MBA6043739.1 hypothetical protein [Pseudomonas lactis]
MELALWIIAILLLLIYLLLRQAVKLLRKDLPKLIKVASDLNVERLDQVAERVEDVRGSIDTLASNRSHQLER